MNGRNVMRGFTLIEALIAVAIVVIVGSIIYGAAVGSGGNSTLSWGANGITEMRCIDGYKFVIGNGGQARQVLDEFGKGARCQ